MSNLSRDSFRYFFRIKDWIPTNLNLVQSFKSIQIEERERILRFAYKNDLKAALIGRLLLRKIVHQRFNLNNQDFKLKRTEHGRPYLSNDEESISPFTNHNIGKLTFDFNMSHAGDYCVAVGDNVSEIGIDVMKIENRQNRNDKNLDDYFRKMRGQFTENEWNFINKNQNDDERIKRFIRLWTLKESYTKAKGFGITVDLLSIEFQCKTDSLKQDEITSDTVLKVKNNKIWNLEKDWTFIEYLLDDHHCVAISINKPNYSDHSFLKEIKFDELINGLDALDDKDLDVWTKYSSKQVRNS